MRVDEVRRDCWRMRGDDHDGWGAMMRVDHDG